MDQTSFSPEQEHGRSTAHTGAFPKSTRDIQESENVICVIDLLNKEMQIPVVYKMKMSYPQLTSSLLGQKLKKLGSETGSDK